MMTAHCRIGRVKLKSGGIVEVPRFDTSGHTAEAITLRDHLNYILAGWGSVIKGFYVIVWDEDGDFTTGSRIDPKQIPPHLLPSFIAEIVRDRTVSEATVKDVLDGNRGA